MKKISAIVIMALLILISLVGCNNNAENTVAGRQNTLNEPPALYVSFNSGDSSEQGFNAVRLSWTWSVLDEDGIIHTTCTDSCGALQLSDYSDITLFLNDDSGEITLGFSDDYQPLSVSAKRWDVKYLEMESDVGFWDEGESIEVIGSKISVRNDGINYIYEVYANWSEGNSYYVFRVSMAGE